MKMGHVFFHSDGDNAPLNIIPGWYYQINLATPVGPFHSAIEAGKAARATIISAAEIQSDGMPQISLTGYTEEDENRFTNFYECDCGEIWEDNWSCQCNDRCPACNREIEPYESRDNHEPAAYAPTRSYLVRWEIDVEASSPQEAAEKARACQVKDDTTATVFDVFECGEHPSDTMRVARIDLSQPEDSEFFTAEQVFNGETDEPTSNSRTGDR